MKVYVSRDALEQLPPGAVVTVVAVPTPTCRYIDSKFRFCTEVAVKDINAVGRNRLPRCRRHFNGSPAASRRNFSQFMFQRAVERKLVSQCEMFHRAEESMERRMDTWEYWEGQNCGGRLDYDLGRWK